MGMEGFVEPPEWLFVVAFLGIAVAVILPIARKLNVGILITVAMVVGVFGAFVIWLQHRNIMDWWRDRGRRDKTDDTHDA